MILATGVIGLIYMAFTQRGKMIGLGYIIIGTVSMGTLSWENWAFLTLVVFVAEVLTWI